MSDIIPFDFEEQAVRVVMRDGEPWFVAADVCRVLEIGNPSDAVSRLDEDERDRVNLNTLDTTEGIRGNPNATIISESGLYALVLTSRKEAARRFRKWITAEVLPAIRRTGRYEQAPPPPAPDTGEDDALTPRDWLAMVREARILGGLNAGRRMWARSPLPPLGLAVGAAAQPAAPAPDPAEARACLDHVIAALDDHGEDAAALALLGLRVIEGFDVFVANNAPLFHGTRWAAGLHRALLRSLPGVAPDHPARRVAGNNTRGLILPAALVTEACDA